MKRSFMHSEDDQGKRKKKRKLIIILLSLLILAAAFLLMLRGYCDTASLDLGQPTQAYLEDEGSSIDGEAENKSSEEILEELEKQQLVVTDKLSSNIVFPSGGVGTIGEWIVENKKENSIIQQAEVYLNEVLIAKSTPIYPNQYITGVELLEEIDPGEYEITAYLNYYDKETKEFISRAGYAIHLTVR